jgi:hypothetical protein
MPSNKDYRLEDVREFTQAFLDYGTYRLAHTSHGHASTHAAGINEEFVVGQLYCPKCADSRRMRVSVQSTTDEKPSLNTAEALGKLVPSLFLLHCVQCSAEFTAVVHHGPDGPALCILPSVRGGLSTSHSPEGVLFYLDQAQRAVSAGAHSAAVAMYRGALDQLLFEQGYTDRMLGAKLAALEKHVATGKGPAWAKEVDHDFLQVLKDLGNGSIHSNDGDTKRQHALDSELIGQVQDTLQLLLFLVYEVPHEKKSRLDSLKAKAALLKK